MLYREVGYGYLVVTLTIIEKNIFTSKLLTKAPFSLILKLGTYICLVISSRVLKNYFFHTYILLFSIY